MQQQRQSVFRSTRPLRTQGGFRAFVQRYDVAIFFALTFLYSWAIWFLGSAFPTTHDWRRMQYIATAGPTLIAIVLSLFLQPSQDRSFTKKHLMVFAIAFVCAAGITWLDSRWWNYPLTGVEITFDLLLALFAAYVIAGAVSPRQGMRQLLHGLKEWRSNLVWILFAVLLWPTLVLLSNGIAHWLGISVPPHPTTPDVPLIPLILESFLWVFLFPGPLSEEPGWRGFALPRLQAKNSPLVASLWIGILWGLWHFPLHVLGNYPFGLAGFMIRLQEIPSAIIFTWLYNRSKGSLLPVLFLHAARNTTSIFLSRAYIPTFVLWLLLACLLIVWDKMWRPLPAPASVSVQPINEHSM